MFRRRKPKPPQLPEPNERTAVRRTDLFVERTIDYVAWKTPDAIPYLCRVSTGEVFIESWQYHPAYDDEPWSVAESIPPGEFLGGRELERAADEFSRPVLDDILAEVRQRNPGAVPIAPEDAEREARRRGRTQARSPSLVAFCAAIVFLAVVGFLMWRTWRRVEEWYALRITSTPVAVTAVVRNPHVALRQYDLPKGRTGHRQEAWITLEYEAAGLVRRRPLLVEKFSQFEREKAQAWLQERYREGDHCDAWFPNLRPDEATLDPTDLRPAIGWVLIDGLLLIFGALLSAGALGVLWLTRPRSPFSPGIEAKT